MDDFHFTDDEFLSVMNMIAKLDAPMGEEYIPFKSLDERIDMGRLDSLSIMVFFVWLTDLFGISEPAIQQYISKGDFSIQAIKTLVMTEYTKNCSMAKVEEFFDRCM